MMPAISLTPMVLNTSSRKSTLRLPSFITYGATKTTVSCLVPHDAAILYP